jgi:hypothetical protein
MITPSLDRKTPFTGLLQLRHPREDVTIHDIETHPVVAKSHMRATQTTGCPRHRRIRARPINLCPTICRLHCFQAGLQLPRIPMPLFNPSSEHKLPEWRDQLHRIVLEHNLLSYKDSVQLPAIDVLGEVEESPLQLPMKPLVWSESIPTYRKYLTYHINISPTTTQQSRTIMPGLLAPT